MTIEPGKNMWKWKLLLPILICISCLLHAQQLHIIELNNRPANELIEVIKPLLQNNEGISGKGYELYLTAGPETTRQIRELVARLDKAPARLLISVRNTQVSTDERSGVTISGSLPDGNARITTGGAQSDRNGLTLSASSRVAHTSERSAPQIHATEGQPALIYSGTSVPITLSDRRHDGSRIIKRKTVEYRPVRSGFYVTAWLNGDNVRLELKQRNDTPGSDGTINTAGTTTTVQGKLGEWITIGGIDTTRSNNNHGLNSVSSVATGNRDNIEIKVIKLD